MATITLAGGRGKVVGKIGHSNPNYTIIILPNGDEAKIPTRIIRKVVH